MKILVTMVLLLTPVLAQEQEFAIDQYEFIWEAYHIQGVVISVEKNENTTRFSLRDNGWLPMSAQEALQLSKDLNMAIKLQAAGDTTEAKSSVLVKGPLFSIRWTSYSTLHIISRELEPKDFKVSNDHNFYFDLNIEQAKAIIPYLEKAPRMISFVDSLIHF